MSPAGGKLWRWKYRFQDKEKRLSIGTYPRVTLKMARGRRDEARNLLESGIDPSEAKKAAKQTPALDDSFEAVAREWHAKFSPNWAPDHAERVLRRFEVDVFPWLGSQRIGEIRPREVLSALRRVESRGALETAHRALQNCGQVFRYAVADGRAERDPTADLRGALPPVRKKHFASITEPNQVGALLRALDVYKGFFVTRCALRLSPLVFVRPGELRKATWDEIDFDAREWRIPAERTKMRETHIVPLSRQSLAILHELHALTGKGVPARPEVPRYLFPGARSRERPMSEVAILAALRRMGFTKDEMTGHGFRHMAATLLNEQGWNRDAIERQMAHAERNKVRATYNYAEYLPERRKMMQAWADYLERLAAGDRKVTSLAMARSARQR